MLQKKKKKSKSYCVFTGFSAVGLFWSCDFSLRSRCSLSPFIKKDKSPQPSDGFGNCHEHFNRPHSELNLSVFNWPRLVARALFLASWNQHVGRHQWFDSCYVFLTSVKCKNWNYKRLAEVVAVHITPQATEVEGISHFLFILNIFRTYFNVSLNTFLIAVATRKRQWLHVVCFQCCRFDYPGVVMANTERIVSKKKKYGCTTRVGKTPAAHQHLQDFVPQRASIC